MINKSCRELIERKKKELWFAEKLNSNSLSDILKLLIEVKAEVANTFTENMPKKLSKRNLQKFIDALTHRGFCNKKHTTYYCQDIVFPANLEGMFCDNFDTYYNTFENNINIISLMDYDCLDSSLVLMIPEESLEWFIGFAGINHLTKFCEGL